jgi:hypothetical protein
MELSEATLSKLKNFAGINSNIVIKEGNTISTISEAKNILAVSEISETFDKCFGIYDLNEFLGVLGLVDQPRVKINEDHAVISDSTGRSKIRYYFSDIEMLTTPTKTAAMPSVDVKFSLDGDTLNKVKRAAAALGHTELTATSGGDGVVTLTVASSDNSTANTFSIDVQGSAEKEEYNFIFNIANLKLMAGNYEVEVSKKLISQFKNNQTDSTYWIAVEKNSSYGE